MTSTLARIGGLLVLTLAGLAACRSDEPSAPAAGDPGHAAAAVETAGLTPTYDDHGMPLGLHQYNPYTDRITSGSQPDGEEGFRNLAALGYRTILSVDGAKPDVETAHRFGLHYVHVPTQYSGMSPDQVAKVAAVLRDADGPVYVHCHHGKHRSPAATGAACVALGLITNEQALDEMKVSGTDPKYAGLFRDVAAEKPFTAEQLASLPDVRTLPEAVKPGDLASAMVDVDQRWDHMKAIKAADWGVPPSNPDVDSPHEALMLWEHFVEIGRLPDVTSRSEDFLKHLAEAEAAAKSLEDALRAKDATAATAAYDRSGKSCGGCHKLYRDN